MENPEDQQEVCPSEKIKKGGIILRPGEMVGGTVHFFETEAAEVAPLNLKLPLSRLHLAKKPPGPPQPAKKDEPEEPNT